MLDQVEKYLADNKDRAVDELKAFLRIPSISAKSECAEAMRKGAAFVREQLSAAGLEAEIVPTAGHPIVYGSLLGVKDAPTVLVYGHYDVQPPEPLELWTTGPFEPTVRDGCIYARGATDDKGQVLTHIKAVEAWMRTQGNLPVNVQFVIEGEEEVGSAHLDRFLADNRDKLRCDVAVVSDTSQYGPGIPAITYGLRGIVACEITLHGPNRDLHSGVFGGAVTNPVNALCRLIGRLHDADGRVAIPGFYDDVRPLGAEERTAFAALPFDEPAWARELGVEATAGEAGFTATERRWARPTCVVNGIIGGYTGEGPKTIIPSRAAAKITCRLVPDQDPEKITASLEEYLRGMLPPGARLDFRRYHGCKGLVFDESGPYMRAARAAIERAFGKAPVMIREGGSIPVVTTFRDVLGVDTLLLGWGQNTDNLHSPNEHFSLDDFHRGTRASACLWWELARSQ